MMNDGGGEVFIAAAGDRYNVPDYAVYASCKGAVEVFARCVVKEYGSRCIRANTVAPAWEAEISRRIVGRSKSLHANTQVA